MQKIVPCLWFDDNAEQAVQFYTSVFSDSQKNETSYYGKSGAEVSGRKEGSPMMVDFEINGYQLMALNGGPLFKFTPAISLFVWCKDQQEIDSLWTKLSKDGSVLMELNKYTWAEKYGWCQDKFGLSWQLIIGENKQRIAPAILFANKVFGKAQEAIDFYTKQFEISKIESLTKDPKTNAIVHAQFTLNNETFVLMEGPGDFEITHAISFVVNCKNQAEIDLYWDRLSKGGGLEQCGWLHDKFGVAWQIVPEKMAELMTNENPAKNENVMKAMFQMKKIDIAKLEQAGR